MKGRFGEKGKQMLENECKGESAHCMRENFESEKMLGGKEEKESKRERVNANCKTAIREQVRLMVTENGRGISRE